MTEQEYHSQYARGRGIAQACGEHATASVTIGITADQLQGIGAVSRRR